MIDIVKSLKERFDIRNIEQVASAENIDLISIELPNAIKGMYYAQEGFEVIALNCDLSDTEKIETFWHEYYHYLLSVGNFVATKFCLDSIKTFANRDENRAEEFVALLMIDTIDEEDTPSSISDRCCVSEKLAELRLCMESKLNSREFN